MHGASQGQRPSDDEHREFGHSDLGPGHSDSANEARPVEWELRRWYCRHATLAKPRPALYQRIRTSQEAGVATASSCMCDQPSTASLLALQAWQRLHHQLFPDQPQAPLLVTLSWLPARFGTCLGGWHILLEAQPALHQATNHSASVRLTVN